MTRRRIRRLAILVAALSASGCARPGSPSGGEVPRTPLRVVETVPAPLALVESFDGPVDVRFERTLSERLIEGLLPNAVIVSPRTGEVSVELSGDRIRIELEGGFTAGTVYRITVLPRFVDRYQNAMAGAHDLVFSTGGALDPTLLAGLTVDRLTLRQLGGTWVSAVPLDGGPSLTTMADSTGVFTFPYMLSGRYDLVAFEDRNGNREPDFSERQATRAVGVNVGDTIVVTDLALLLPDTTAAVVQSVGLLDSLAVRAVFDDYLDPEGGIETVTARLIREGANAPEILEVLFRHAWDERRAPLRDPDQGPAPAPRPSLPGREIVLILSRPLIEGATYRVEVEGVTNLNGVPGGGGQAELQGPSPG